MASDPHPSQIWQPTPNPSLIWQEHDAWLVKYPDGFTEHFEEEELRSGKDGPAPPPGQDGKPVLVVRGLPDRDKMYEAFIPGFDYLEDRLTGNCEANYSCVQVLELWRVVRAFNPNFAAQHLDTVFIDSMSAITALEGLGLLAGLKQELPAYLAAAAGAPVFDPSSVDDFTEAVLGWWRINGKSFPKWAQAARIAFALSPNSASCERVFSQLKLMFGDQQWAALGDYVRAALMLRINKRRIG